MIGRTTLAAALVAGALAASVPAVSVRAADPSQGGANLTPDAKEAMDLGSPHRSRLTTQQEDELNRAAEVRQQQEIAEWSKLLGGEQGQVQPMIGGGVVNPHEQQAEVPAAPGQQQPQGQELPLH